ncbi:MAG: metal ABC transporter permease [Alphaproteobacteria bacterium]|nr:metal ABC transporter permease [Alphaproteobacteria bacterium]MDA7982978.1 metal ABC transporter permease [Alphaproteobacteria bacterium]MDA8000077.1 metal ABC transporter permease [Alphaproteobacteria bacterium]MDA8003834.1 metal ABC transporter permease [Alphaproteobacteria bacterium]MDA8005650.1 metal ABC transporter permease [Alphaproteobacteria bacterium]
MFADFAAVLGEPFVRDAFALVLVCGLLAGPLGCFVIWRRMAYLGDALAHVALLGVSLGIVAGVSPLFPAVAVTLGASALMSPLERASGLSRDAVLGIFAHGALALAVLLVVIAAPYGVAGLHGFFFGDVFASSPGERRAVFAAAFGALLVLGVLRRPLLRVVLSRDLARAEGLPAALLEAVLAVVMAVAVVMAMWVVGLLLTATLLVLPAASARMWSRSPEGMALLAGLFALAATGGGFCLALFFDLPGGPTIALFSLCLFITSLSANRFWH